MQRPLVIFRYPVGNRPHSLDFHYTSHGPWGAQKESTSFLERQSCSKHIEFNGGNVPQIISHSHEDNSKPEDDKYEGLESDIGSS
jgi:hypothetical protein